MPLATVPSLPTPNISPRRGTEVEVIRVMAGLATKWKAGSQAPVSFMKEQGSDIRRKEEDGNRMGESGNAKWYKSQSLRVLFTCCCCLDF